MTRLVSLACPGCQAPVEPTRLERACVFACARCPTAVEVTRAGLQAYPIRSATGAATTGLYWALAGQMTVNRFAASEPAVTELGEVSHEAQTLPFAFSVPCADLGIPLALASACRRAAKPLVAGPWTPDPGRTPQQGSLGRADAERIAHQVWVNLITRAEGRIHQLDVSIAVTSCVVLRVD